MAMLESEAQARDLAGRLERQVDHLELTMRRVAEKLRQPRDGWSARTAEAGELEQAIREADAI
jgi:hypothetical protein